MNQSAGGIYNGSIKALRRLCDDLIADNQPLFSALLQYNIVSDQQTLQRYFTQAFDGEMRDAGQRDTYSALESYGFQHSKFISNVTDIF